MGAHRLWTTVDVKWTDVSGRRERAGRGCVRIFIGNCQPIF